MARLRSPMVLVLTPTERSKLEAITRATTAPHAKVQRAQIVLRFAAGESLSQIARALGLQRNVARKWVKRFTQKRIQGLHDLPRAGRPPAFPPGGGAAHRQDRVRAP